MKDCAVVSLLWIALCAWALPGVVFAAGVVRSGDLAADVSHLRTLGRDAWLDLTVQDLGEAWWILHEARQADPARFGTLTLAVRINGRNGYVDTRRLDPVGGLGSAVPADLYQSYTGGNFSILVSGQTPPRRPRTRPLAWGGFLWEGLEAPDTLLGAVFDDVAVMPRREIAFAGASMLRAQTTGGPAPFAGDTTATGLAPVQVGPGEAASSAASAVAELARLPPSAASAAPPVSALASSSADASPRAQKAPRPPAQPAAVTALRDAPEPLPPIPPVPITIPRRLDGDADEGRASRLPARLDDDRRVRRISAFNQTLRRQVAYLEALLRGPELGRSIDLDSTVGELIDLITQGQSTPQRNVFLRIDLGVDLKVGRVVNATRYPLYNVTGAGSGSYSVLVDLEVRGPDGRKLVNGAGQRRAASGPVQFKDLQEDTPLRALGIRQAVWWPVPERRQP